MDQPSAVAKQLELLHGLAIQWESESERILEAEQPLGRSIDHAITQLRSTYQDIIFLNFEYAIAHAIENKIWTKNHKVIQRYKQNILLRESAGKKKPVELRKMIINFVNFIKATTKLYCGFIQRLASHFAVYELQRVVEQFRLTSKIS
ncbi:hypothetical protein BDZ91DRAFT_27610 [Kalaharituber pfeilii]|nr:hypothetical protein BDZ91DRAFT_27610 [Kalaharituber pfeilii]